MENKRVCVKDLIKQEYEELGLTHDEKKFLNLKHSGKKRIHWSVLKARGLKRKDNGKRRK